MREPLFACQEQLVPGKTYSEKFDFLAQTGFQGIEIWSQNLAGHTDELKGLVSSTGVKVSSGCQGFDGGVINVNEDGRRMAISATIDALQELAEVHASGFVMPTGFALGSKVLPPFKPPRPADEDAQALRDALEKILPHAAKNQVSIFLEPINRYEIHYLNTLAEANEIVSALDNPWLKVMADTFHMSIEEANLAQSLTLAASRLGHVHLADSNRRLPGQGHLDFVPIFRTLRKTGYQGWLAIECDRPADPVRELPAAFQYLQECWERAKE